MFFRLADALYQPCHQHCSGGGRQQMFECMTADRVQRGEQLMIVQFRRLGHHTKADRNTECDTVAAWCTVERLPQWNQHQRQ